MSTTAAKKARLATAAKKKAGLKMSLRPQDREFFQTYSIPNSKGARSLSMYGHQAPANTGYVKLDNADVQSELTAVVFIGTSPEGISEFQGHLAEHAHSTLLSALVANWQAVRAPEWKGYRQACIEPRTSGENEFERIAAELYGWNFGSRREPRPASEESVKHQAVARDEWVQNADSILERLECGEESSDESITAVQFAEFTAFSEKERPSPSETEYWELCEEAILERLERLETPFQERLTAVFVAETTGFNDEQRPRLVRALFEFCTTHRFTDNEELETAVGSAIRKLALNMAPDDFERYAELFAPTETDTLSCVIELELAKAVSWRLEKLTRQQPGEFHHLESRLTDLASDYLTPRLILQKNHASTVIHAVIALVLLKAAKHEQLVGRIAGLGIEWFRDLFERRLREVAKRRGEVDSSSDEVILHLCDELASKALGG
ncbi:MAG: hypothetical protein HQ518_04010 [Rhodopirellula sp.]|nr:hypothetical protein [Rhodopirellula sp.]